MPPEAFFTAPPFAIGRIERSYTLFGLMVSESGLRGGRGLDFGGRFGLAFGRGDFISVSGADGYSANGTGEEHFRVPYGVPPKQAATLSHRRVGAGVAQRLWVYYTHAPKKILWVVRVNYVVTDAHARTLSVFELPDKVCQGVPKPGLVAVTKRFFACRIGHLYPLPGVKCSDARSSSSSAAS
tara:strand:+ start:514 stop:1062 length:549 start_codon:yes stop_codon:yes gene_type:complete